MFTLQYFRLTFLLFFTSELFKLFVHIATLSNLFLNLYMNQILNTLILIAHYKANF